MRKLLAIGIMSLLSSVSAYATDLTIATSYCQVFPLVARSTVDYAPPCYNLRGVSRLSLSIYRVPSGEPQFLDVGQTRQPDKVVRTNSRGVIRLTLRPGFYVVQVSDARQLATRTHDTAAAACDLAVVLGSDYSGSRLYYIHGARRFARFEVYPRCPV